MYNREACALTLAIKEIVVNSNFLRNVVIYTNNIELVEAIANLSTNIV